MAGHFYSQLQAGELLSRNLPNTMVCIQWYECGGAHVSAKRVRCWLCGSCCAFMTACSSGVLLNVKPPCGLVRSPELRHILPHCCQ